MMNPEYTESMRSQRKSEGTIKVYCGHINEFLAFCGKAEDQITLADWERYMNFQNNKGVSPATLNNKLNAVRSYMVFCKRHGIIESNPIAEVEQVRNEHPKTKEYMSPEDVKALADEADTPMEKALVIAFFSTGMRFSEMTGITTECYESMLNSGKDFIRIIGKGGKARQVPFNSAAKAAIGEYLTYAKAADASNADKTLLFHGRRGAAIREDEFAKTLKAMAKRASLSYADSVSPHWLRAASFSNLSRLGVPIATIQKIAGHSDIRMTSKYIYVPEEDLCNAVNNLNL